MRPRVGLRNLVSILKQVVLPAPLGPIKAWIVRRLTRRLTPLTAINPANSLVKTSVSRIISLLIHAPSLTVSQISAPRRCCDWSIATWTSRQASARGGGAETGRGGGVSGGGCRGGARRR